MVTDLLHPPPLRLLRRLLRPVLVVVVSVLNTRGVEEEKFKNMTLNGSFKTSIMVHTFKNKLQGKRG